MQKLCTAGLTGDGRTPTTDHHTFAPVDLTAPKNGGGGVASIHSLTPRIRVSSLHGSPDQSTTPSFDLEPIWRRWKTGRFLMPRGSNKDKNGKILEGTSLANAAGIFGWVSGINAVG